MHVLFCSDSLVGTKRSTNRNTGTSVCVTTISLGSTVQWWLQVCVWPKAAGPSSVNSRVNWDEFVHYQSRFWKSTHISMISNSVTVTNLRSYTNADIAGNSARAPSADVTALSFDVSVLSFDVSALSADIITSNGERLGVLQCFKSVSWCFTKF